MINFYYEDISDPQLISVSTSKWIEKVAQIHGFNLGELSVVFCSDEYLLKMNQEYLQHDYYTDIITFDYSSKSHISGDLFISLETVQSNSEKFQTSFQNEFFRVLIHGILHLLGFKDKTDEEQKIMTSKEDEALSMLPTFL